MAVKHCRECGGPVSADAKACPHCEAFEQAHSFGRIAGPIVVCGCFIVFVLIALFVALAIPSLGGGSGPKFNNGQLPVAH